MVGHPEEAWVVPHLKGSALEKYLELKGGLVGMEDTLPAWCMQAMLPRVFKERERARNEDRRIHLNGWMEAFRSHQAGKEALPTYLIEMGHAHHYDLPLKAASVQNNVTKSLYGEEALEMCPSVPKFEGWKSLEASGKRFEHYETEADTRPNSPVPLDSTEDEALNQLNSALICLNKKRFCNALAYCFDRLSIQRNDGPGHLDICLTLAESSGALFLYNYITLSFLEEAISYCQTKYDRFKVVRTTQRILGEWGCFGAECRLFQRASDPDLQSHYRMESLRAHLDTGYTEVINLLALQMCREIYHSACNNCKEEQRLWCLSRDTNRILKRLRQLVTQEQHFEKGVKDYYLCLGQVLEAADLCLVRALRKQDLIKSLLSSASLLSKVACSNLATKDQCFFQLKGLSHLLAFMKRPVAEDDYLYNMTLLESLVGELTRMKTSGLAADIFFLHAIILTLFGFKTKLCYTTWRKAHTHLAGSTERSYRLPLFNACLLVLGQKVSHQAGKGMLDLSPGLARAPVEKQEVAERFIEGEPPYTVPEMLNMFDDEEEEEEEGGSRSKKMKLIPVIVEDEDEEEERLEMSQKVLSAEAMAHHDQILLDALHFGRESIEQNLTL
jgi:hypothetical protein